VALLDFLNIGTHIIDKLIPDPAQKAEAKLKLLELQQNGELKALEADLTLAQQQTDIDKIEAADPSLFKSGWRPAVGWICVVGLGYSFLIQPVGSWISAMYGKMPLLVLDTSVLMTLLLGMLGLGGFRTYEKLQDKAD
jgi:hypothetical protein